MILLIQNMKFSNEIPFILWIYPSNIDLVIFLLQNKVIILVTIIELNISYMKTNTAYDKGRVHWI